MKTKPFAVGLCLGAVLGALATFGFYQATEEPVYLHIAGAIEVDTATHREGYLDNAIYFPGTVVLQEPVYLNSENIDLYPFAGKSVSVAGPVETWLVKDGYSILEMDVQDIRQIQP